eukprot:10766646-Ditylum_brightwellii.AAC.1
MEGGANGHLGLVCDTTTYSRIPDATAYLCLLNPGQLTVTATATQAQIAQLQDQHKESLCLFQEVTNIKRTIIQ